MFFSAELENISKTSMLSHNNTKSIKDVLTVKLSKLKNQITEQSLGLLYFSVQSVITTYNQANVETLHVVIRKKFKCLTFIKIINILFY